MQLIKSKAINYNDKDKVFFSKKELQIILQLYSKQVSCGTCRDYSIDNIKKKAVFSFFKSPFDKPLFQIEKKKDAKNILSFQFNLTYKQKIIETNVSITKILRRLDKRFEFFNKNKKG